LSIAMRSRKNSRDMEGQNELSQNQRIGGDRRDDCRYQIPLELRWKLIRRRKVLNSGEGETVDLSSGGILFDARRPLPVGLDVELSIAWPILLNDTAPMQLVVMGRIVRSAGNITGIRMVQHEFRTMGVPADARRNDAPARTPVVVMNPARASSCDVLH
jgi:hypothetical protein